MQKLSRYFIISAGTILLITATAKLISAGGHSRILALPDEILGIPYRCLFLIAGIFELVISMICLFGRNPFLQSAIIAWLSSILLIYRIGLLVLGAKLVCSCLGTLTDAIDMPPKTASFWMGIILGYLIIGSSAILLGSRKNKTQETVPL